MNSNGGQPLGRRTMLLYNKSIAIKLRFMKLIEINETNTYDNRIGIYDIKIEGASNEAWITNNFNSGNIICLLLFWFWTFW